MTAPTPALSSPAALMEVIQEFDGLGIHRTGSRGDDATTEWLIRRLARVGVEGSAHAFLFPLLDMRRAVVEVGAATVEGHAQMDAGLTPAAGVTGRLVPADSAGPAALGVLDIDVGATAGHEVETAIQRCVAAGAAGLIVVARRGAGSIFLMNAPHLSWPAPLPVLFVPPAQAAPVLEGLAVGMDAHLVVDGVRRPATATNVVARIPADARGADAAPLAVMTPKSGWFTCAAERGGGIAIWLAVAEMLTRMTGRTRDVLLLATSGHELGHAGLEAYLLEHPGLAAEVSVWVHLGASIGAAVQPAMRLFASDDALRREAQAALALTGAGPYRVAPAGLAPGGEARNIGARGGRFVSLAGGHAFFHTPEDRPEAVDSASLARYAAAVLALVRAEVRQTYPPNPLP